MLPPMPLVFADAFIVIVDFLKLWDNAVLALSYTATAARQKK